MKLSSYQKEVLIFFLLLIPLKVFGHTSGDVAGGLLSGISHPITGIDHVVAMVAVGLWGAQLGRPAIWILPITFPALMAFGGSLGVAGVPLPGIEIGIAVSSIVLGLMVALAYRAKLWLAMLIVAFFAVFHGHAHGTELPHSAAPLAYGVGFVFTTGALHATGILIGTVYKWRSGRLVVRAGGVLIALTGVWYLIQTI